MTADKKLAEIAKVIRSKNSGPFELTFDVMFDKPDVYRQVKASGAVTRASLGRLYGVSDEEIITFQFFDPALAFKFTIRRPGAQGSVGETDTFGAQQYVPLFDLIIPAEFTPNDRN
jgi:hypothetical protein